MMSEKQKVIIWRSLLGIIIFGSLIMFSVSIWLLFHKDAAASKIGVLLANITNLISPATIFGVAIKLIVNKRHKSEISSMLAEYYKEGYEMKIKPNNEMIANTQHKELPKKISKTLLHNEKIANEIRMQAGDKLRGMQFYTLQDIINSNKDRKERMRLIVDLLRLHDVDINKEMQSLIKDIY